MRPLYYASPGVGYHTRARPVTEEDLRVMEMPRRFWYANREAWSERASVLRTLNGYAQAAAKLISEGDPSLVLLRGGHGSGKSSAAAIIAKIARAHRFTVYWVDAGQVMDLWRRSAPTADSELNPRERAYDTEVLVLDGLGSGYATNEYVSSETHALLKWRQDAKRVTIVTTALDDEALAMTYGLGMLAVLAESSVVHDLDIGDLRVQSIAGEAE